ncbi:MAG: subclass B3 metallo-beta-lactamase [Rhodanobacteraceae bacterium]
MSRLLSAAVLALVLIPQGARATTPVSPPPEGRAAWNAPQAPFRIYGNTWYVGTRGLTSILITSPSGDVLIDGDLPESAPLIEQHIRALGFRLADVKLILNTHAHYDHAGGIAQLQRDSGAQVVASVAGAELMARGGHGDPQYGDTYSYAPPQRIRTIADGKTLKVGPLAITAHLTPGHTPGSTTWTWRSCEAGRCLDIVYADSLSTPDYKLVSNPNYPGIIGDYRHSFEVVAALPCDIVLTPHPDMVDFWGRVGRRQSGNADALIDRNGCRDYAKDASAAFEAKLAVQEAAAK